MGRYCSIACRSIGKRDESATDRNSWQYKEWRRKVYERDGYTCQRCGTNNNLHAHHIKLWSRYPALRFDLDNGLTLCDRCHYDWHKEHGTVYDGYRIPI